MNNEKKYKKYLNKKIMKYLLIFLGISIIVLEILALFNVISFIWGLIAFIIFYILKYFYTKWLILWNFFVKIII